MAASGLTEGELVTLREIPLLCPWARGALAVKLVRPEVPGEDKGLLLVVYPTVFLEGKLCRGPDETFGFDSYWMYKTLPEAVAALADWEGEGDPPGSPVVSHNNETGVRT